MYQLSDENDNPMMIENRNNLLDLLRNCDLPDNNFFQDSKYYNMDELKDKIFE